MDSYPQATTKPKAPTLVGIITILMLLGGIMSLLSAVIFGVYSAAAGAVVIITAIGVRKMKRWGLYLFTLVTIVSVVAIIYYKLYIDNFGNVAGILINVVALIYLWSISKKFN